jgi:hypothetical protein
MSRLSILIAKPGSGNLRVSVSASFCYCPVTALLNRPVQAKSDMPSLTAPYSPLDMVYTASEFLHSYATLLQRPWNVQSKVQIYLKQLFLS